MVNISNKISGFVPFVNSNDDEMDSSVDNVETESGSESKSDTQVDIENERSDPNNYFAPEDAIWYKDKVVMNGKHARTYAIDSWPPTPHQHMFSNLIINADMDYDLALHFDPYPDNKAVEILDDLQTKLNDKRTGEFARYIPNKGSLQETESVAEVMKNYINKGESMLDTSFYLTVYADTEDELEQYHEMVMNDLVRSSNVSITNCPLRQKEALQSCSPIAKDVLGEKNGELKQKMLGSAAARSFPFIQDTFMEENGVMFGVNEESMTPVFIDIFNRRNGYNMLSSGMIGAGKTFSSSQVLLSMDAAYPDLKQFFIDPMGNFQGVANCLDGERFVINGTESINPMEIKETPKEVIEKSQGQINPMAMKKQELKWFFTQFFEGIGGDDSSLSNKEIATLDTAITKTYSDKGITEDLSTHHKESPTIMDLIETLEEMAEDTEKFTATNTEVELQEQKKVAVDLLLSMKHFREGGEYHNLAQPTDIDITGERTVYLDMTQIPNNSDDLGVIMKLLFMKIYQEAKKTGDKVAFTIDEAHKIMADSGIVSGLEEMFRHSRHFDLSINLISQTPEEFYATETARTIAKQCTIKKFHRVDKLDKDIAKDALDLNDQEINYIENAEAGEGKKDFSQALLQISDEDRTIPLRIYATRDEQIVIDYDPSESPDEYPDKPSRMLKRALDAKNAVNVPTYVGDEDELAWEVAAQIAKKQENLDNLVDQYQSQKEAIEQKEDDDEDDEQVSMKAEESLFDRLEDTTTATQQEDGDEYENLKRRLGSPAAVDEENENTIRLISKRYGIAEDVEDVETVKKAIKSTVFDLDLGIDIDELNKNGESSEQSSEEIEEPEGVERVEEDEEDEEDGERDDEDTSDDEGEEDSPTNSVSETTEPVDIDVENIPDEQLDQLYLQYVGDGDLGDKSPDEKRAAIKQAIE